MYQYRATVVRVLDGDTVLLDVDLGFYVTVRQSCRLMGINARELHDIGGPEARDHLLGLLPVKASVNLESVKPDKFAGRFDGLIFVLPGVSVNQFMVKDGYAATWDGTGTRPVPPWPIPERA
jgi:micrococcal nuclease